MNDDIMVSVPGCRLPNTLIAGAQKSGTTWLHKALGRSAHVFASVPKELNFFNKHPHRRNLQDYMRHFPLQPEVKTYLESTPHYFRLPRNGNDRAQNIRDLLGGACRIILCFRNPVDRYESAYIHHMMKGRFPYALRIDEVTDRYQMLSFGLYAEILAHWQRFFPDMHLVFYDDIVADPMAVLEAAMAYLGSPCDLTPRDAGIRPNDKATKIRRLPLDWSEMPRLSARARDELTAYYAASVADLETHLGRDLPTWRG